MATFRRKFVADAAFYAELREVFNRELNYDDRSQVPLTQVEDDQSSIPLRQELDSLHTRLEEDGSSSSRSAALSAMEQRMAEQERELIETKRELSEMKEVVSDMKMMWSFMQEDPRFQEYLGSQRPPSAQDPATESSPSQGQ